MKAVGTYSFMHPTQRHRLAVSFPPKPHTTAHTALPQRAQNGSEPAARPACRHEHCGGWNPACGGCRALVRARPLADRGGRGAKRHPITPRRLSTCHEQARTQSAADRDGGNFAPVPPHPHATPLPGHATSPRPSSRPSSCATAPRLLTPSAAGRRTWCSASWTEKTTSAWRGRLATRCASAQSLQHAHPVEQQGKPLGGGLLLVK